MATRQPAPLDDDEVVYEPVPADLDPANSEVTRPSDLGFGGGRRREIEVERLRDEPVEPDADGMVEIRMAETIEEFTYGNPHQHYRLEAGKRYRVPLHIAEYLFDMGKLYLRG